MGDVCVRAIDDLPCFVIVRVILPSQLSCPGSSVTEHLSRDGRVSWI